MIDAITEGRTYAYAYGDHAVAFASPDRVTFYPLASPANFTEVTTPRQAREIAGLLVAWASAKENSNDAGS